MKVLVTGGAGLIGMALRQGLGHIGHEVIAIDITDFGRGDSGLAQLSLADHTGLEALVADHGIEAIVHGGGISGPVMQREHPMLVADVNIMATAALLDIARRHRLKRFILLSSHVVYGHVGAALIQEERAPHPTTTYAATKVAGEALVESFAREWGLSGASLRLTRVYGAYRRANCFLRQILLDNAAGKPTIVPCEPGYLYHYLYVDDVVGAVGACLAAQHLQHATYNLASGEALTMDAVVATVRDVLPSALVSLVDGRDDAPEVQTQFDLSQIAADTGWVPRFVLARGFADYALRFVNNPGIAS